VQAFSGSHTLHDANTTISHAGSTNPARVAAIAALAMLLVQPALPAAAAPMSAAPHEHRCEVPAKSPAAPAVPATPVAKRATPAAPAATPVGANAAAATVVADHAAVDPMAEAEANPDPDAAELAAIAHALAACLTDGDARGVTNLVTDDWLGGFFGGESMSREQFLSLAPGLGWLPVDVRSITNVKITGKTATADVTYVMGHQLTRSSWSFRTVADAKATQTAWRVNSESPLSVPTPRDAARIEVTLGENLMQLSVSEVVGEHVLLQGKNTGAVDHEMLVLEFQPGYSLTDLLRSTGPGLPEQAEWIGQTTVPAGAADDLVLTGLEPGLYWVVCLLPNPDGSLHAGYQEAVAFTVK
jgi:hypothetical protein